jgi:hypothetical protein
MANIKVNDLSKLNLSGTELFDDSESFLTELNDENEHMQVMGGGICVVDSCAQMSICPRSCNSISCLAKSWVGL